MFDFKSDTEALSFLAKFTSSDTWKWFEQVIKSKHEAIFQELSNSKTTADGRAMLTGRLLETKYFLDFPLRSFEYYRGQEALRKAAFADANSAQQNAIINKVAFPEVVIN